MVGDSLIFAKGSLIEGIMDEDGQSFENNYFRYIGSNTSERRGKGLIQENESLSVSTKSYLEETFEAQSCFRLARKQKNGCSSRWLRAWAKLA